MDEGEQLEQVEPAQVRIAEPLPDERRVEDDVRSLRCPRDRFAAARLAHLAAAGQPNPGVGCMKRGEDKRHSAKLVRVSFPRASAFATVRLSARATARRGTGNRFGDDRE